jgi:UDP-glucose 4-epimerase
VGLQCLTWYKTPIEKVIDNGVQVFNLGTGNGTSVLELVTAFNNVNGNLIKYSFADKRSGDVPEYYANTDKAKRDLGWEAKESIDDMCKDSWNFIKNQNN